MADNSTHSADGRSWAMLLLLSLIWGGSFLFIAIAVKELAPLQLVFARVAIAALLLLPIHLALRGSLPRDRKTWIAAGGMSVMNNILPFTLIVWGQQYISGGLASVVNATTPIFTVIFLAMAGLEGITWRKSIALAVGFVGVIVIKGGNIGDLSDQSLGVLAVLAAAGFYGLSAPWSKLRLAGISPLTTATCQLILSSIGMLVVVLLFGDMQQYAVASATTWLALLGLAGLSTSLAYLLFFQIIARAGPSFVSLCTMLIPVSAILLGYAVLGERLTWNEVIGALIIGVALIVIDGRLLKRVWPQSHP